MSFLVLKAYVQNTHSSSTNQSRRRWQNFVSYIRLILGTALGFRCNLVLIISLSTMQAEFTFGPLRPSEAPNLNDINIKLQPSSQNPQQQICICNKRIQRLRGESVDKPINVSAKHNSYFEWYIYGIRCIRWRSWLRHCTASRKVAGSIPNGVIGIFYWLRPSCRTIALGSTQPLTEMSIGVIARA
jgi:hypothetical protein